MMNARKVLGFERALWKVLDGDEVVVLLARSEYVSIWDQANAETKLRKGKVI